MRRTAVCSLKLVLYEKSILRPTGWAGTYWMGPGLPVHKIRRFNRRSQNSLLVEAFLYLKVHRGRLRLKDISEGNSNLWTERWYDSGTDRLILMGCYNKFQVITTLCLIKTPHLWFAINLTNVNRFWYFFGRNVTDKVNDQKTLYYATSNNLYFCTTW